MKDYMSFADRDVRLFDRGHTIFVVDESGSMAERIGGSSRLECAKDAFGRLIGVKLRAYPQDVVAVVSFSDSAIIRHAGAMVGTGHPALLKCMEDVQPDQNTAIGLGLSMARRVLLRLVGQNTGRRTRSQVILLTDGENNQSPDPVEIAAELKEDGVWIDAIGIGNTQDLDVTCVRTIASTRPDGTPSYQFIDNPEHLGNHLAELAQHHLMPL